MIEWWQAVAVSGVTAVITAGGMLAVQLRQQGHDTRMQERRLEAERTQRQEDAQRAVKRERLQPLFDALDELDQLFGEQILAAARDPQGQAGHSVKLRVDSSRISANIIALTYRVRDVSLVEGLLELGSKLMEPVIDTDWHVENAPSIHAQLEAYGASLGQMSEDQT